MTDPKSPKAELILTLDAMAAAFQSSGVAEVRLAAIRGLLDHARALALRVGSVSKPRKEKGA
jgi:hypothetical protein